MITGKIRIGNGYDVHAFAPGLPLWICGIKIEHEKGCIAHSDGDAPLHALCDALLGALALGDIGKYFPDTSLKYKDIDSKILLSKVYEMVLAKGYHLINCDITIALERPKIGIHIDKMRAVIATILGSDINDISIKATTSEKIGFVGREEGIATYATVLIGR